MWSSTRLWSFFWIFLLFLLQNTLHFIFPFEIFPFLLVGVIFYALSEGPFFGWVIGSYAGFFLDLLGIGRIGPQVCLYGFVGAFSGWSASTLFRDSLWTQILFPVVLNAALLILTPLVLQDFLWEERGFIFFSTGAEWRSMLLALFLSPWLFRFLKAVSFAPRERSLRWR